MMQFIIHPIFSILIDVVVLWLFFFFIWLNNLFLQEKVVEKTPPKLIY